MSGGELSLSSVLDIQGWNSRPFNDRVVRVNNRN